MKTVKTLYLKRMDPLDAKSLSFRFFVEFDDGTEQEAQMVHVGGNRVVVCEEGIIILEGIIL
jgi:hypothetical protein